jgi:hypothetical protein
MSLPGARIVVKEGEEEELKGEGGQEYSAWESRGTAWLGAAAYAPGLPLCV